MMCKALMFKQEIYHAHFEPMENFKFLFKTKD